MYIYIYMEEPPFLLTGMLENSGWISNNNDNK